jgi:hypothetical protein
VKSLRNFEHDGEVDAEDEADGDESVLGQERAKQDPDFNSGGQCYHLGIHDLAAWSSGVVSAFGDSQKRVGGYIVNFFYGDQ